MSKIFRVSLKLGLKVTSARRLKVTLANNFILVYLYIYTFAATYRITNNIELIENLPKTIRYHFKYISFKNFIYICFHLQKKSWTIDQTKSYIKSINNHRFHSPKKPIDLHIHGYIESTIETHNPV